MDTFDYYTNKEEIFEERNRKRSKYVWKQSLINKTQFDDSFMDKNSLILRKQDLIKKLS